ncbi:HAMP domain-containing protein [bacterium]|nr:HAMP domain-containing protein [bacterium]
MTESPSLVQRLLRIPLFYKILLGNSLIVTLGAAAGTVVTVWHVRRYPEDLHLWLIGVFVVVGLIVSFLVNNVILRVALKPLDRLQEGVNAVGQGRLLDVHVYNGGPSDERFDRLIETFNQMVAQQQADAHRLQTLSHRILQAQEDERQRVARELHDEAAQALTSLLLHLRLLERAYTPEQAQQRVHELRELTAQALEEVRRVALDLRPKILDDLGLIAALGWRVDELNADGRAKATLRIEGVTERMPRTVELVFYRVAQEAMNNAARHAEANNVTLTLARRADLLSLEIVDDGKGFDPAAKLGGKYDAVTHSTGGLGLAGIRERMSMIGGTGEIQSSPGQGTRVAVIVSLLALPADENDNIQSARATVVTTAPTAQPALK